MKIAIIGAMEEEVNPLIEYFKPLKKESKGGNTYHLIEYNGVEIVLANSKIGKVFSTITATTMIQDYGCDIVLFTGVAGAINKDLKIGEIIIGERLCQHDLDITAFGRPAGYVPGGKVFTYSDKGLITIAKEVAKINDLKTIVGTIASGDQFVYQKEKKDFISKTFEADAIEMEGCSVAVVCDMFEVPFLVIRTISDEAEGNAEVNFEEFLQLAANNAANYMIKIVDKLTKK